MNKLLLTIYTMLCLVSCQNHTVYHLYQPVQQTGWTKGDTILYTLPSPESMVSQHLEIGIRHKDSYLYRDIWLCILQPEKTDTFHLYLADESGHWKGHGIGDMRLYTEVLPISIQPKDSIHSFQIAHIMEDDTLRGIHDIGICIQKVP